MAGAVSAHPGGYDADGCHVEKATGEHHCHVSDPEPTAEDRMSCVELPRCRGCGCQGGPGYRDTETRDCVGYEEMAKVCGLPPTSDRCTFEGHPNTGRNARCVLGKERAETMLSLILPQLRDPQS